MSVLSPVFSKVQLVYNICTKGVHDGVDTPHSEAATSILNVLYTTLDEELSCSGSQDHSDKEREYICMNETATMLMDMYVDTSKPYLEMLEMWIYEGT